MGFLSSDSVTDSSMSATTLSLHVKELRDDSNYTKGRISENYFWVKVVFVILARMLT